MEIYIELYVKWQVPVSLVSYELFLKNHESRHRESGKKLDVEEE